MGSLPTPPMEDLHSHSNFPRNTLGLRRASKHSKQSPYRSSKRTSMSSSASLGAHAHESPISVNDGRHKRVWKACERCRMKKTKCDGESPCKRCKDDGLVCTAGSRKKTEFKQLPRGYAEVLENTQYALIATVHKLYQMVRANEPWTLGEPDTNERGQPVIHNIASKLGCIRPSPDMPYGFPEGEEGLEELQRQLKAEELVVGASARHHDSISSGDEVHKFGAVSSPSPTESVFGVGIKQEPLSSTGMMRRESSLSDSESDHSGDFHLHMPNHGLPAIPPFNAVNSQQLRQQHQAHRIPFASHSPQQQGGQSQQQSQRFNTLPSQGRPEPLKLSQMSSSPPSLHHSNSSFSTSSYTPRSSFDNVSGGAFNDCTLSATPSRLTTPLFDTSAHSLSAHSLSAHSLSAPPLSAQSSSHSSEFPPWGNDGFLSPGALENDAGRGALGALGDGNMEFLRRQQMHLIREHHHMLMMRGMGGNGMGNGMDGTIRPGMLEIGHGSMEGVLFAGAY